MPSTNRKRRADDLASGDDEDSPPRSSRPKKLTKEEKAAARARAAAAMGQAAPTPLKRRKLNTSEGPKSAKKAATTPRAAAPAPAPATTAKKKSRKEEQAAARARAAQWAEGSKNKSAEKPAPAPAPTTRPTSSSSTSAASSTARRKSTGSSTAAVASPSARRSTAASRATGSRNTANTGRSSTGIRRGEPRPEEPQTIPNPPAPRSYRRQGDTPTGQQTNEQAPGVAFTAVLQQPPAAPTSPPVVEMAAPIPAKMDTGVVAPRRMVVEPVVVQPPAIPETYGTEEEDERMMSPKERINTLLGSKCFLYLLLPMAVVTTALYARGSLVSKYGQLMILGTTRVPFQRKDKAYTIEADQPIDLASLAQPICYQDSPASVLEWVEEEVLKAVSETDCSDAVKQSCPKNAICYKGALVDCQGPVYAMLDPEETAPLCVLSKAVNETYDEIVGLLESWSIHQMCLTHVDDVAPLAFYTTNTTDPTDLVVAGADETKEGIPLYPWQTIFKEGPESLEGWDLELLEIVNQAHQQLVLEESNVVGLTKNRFALVESTKLPTACKASRLLIATLDWVGKTVLGLLIALLGFFWYALRVHPYLTVSTSAVVGLVVWWRRRRQTQQRQLKRINEIRQMTLRRLQMALHNEPGQGMRKGEIAVMHLRDSLVSYYHGGDSERTRHEFMYVLWPKVAQQIQRDNRVGKTQRAVSGVRRELWMWVAAEEDGNNN